MSSWYFSKDGQQEGPVTAGQIVALVNASTLDPAVTQVWREGLADWIPLQQSPVFDEARSLPAPTIAPVKPVVPATPYIVSPQALASSRANRPEMPLEYPGIGRLAYFLISMGLCIVFYAILFVIIFASLRSDSGAGMAMGALLVGLLFAVGFFFLAVKRIVNLGMSGWAILWALVPFMNLWIHWRLLACPAGYQDHLTLDTAGKIITGLWIGMFALAFLAPVIGGLIRG
ncbi:MAG: GYF domain-containing protein [Luteolibacter sp.]